MSVTQVTTSQGTYFRLVHQTTSPIFDGLDIFDQVGIAMGSADAARDRMFVVAKAGIENEDHHDWKWRVEARDADENLVGYIDFGVRADEADG